MHVGSVCFFSVFVATLKETLLDLWVKACFDFQVWEEDYGGLFSWLWTCGVAPAGGVGSGRWWGRTLWNAVTAGWRAPAHQAGIRLPRQSPLLPLHDINHKVDISFFFFTKGKWHFSVEKKWPVGQHNEQCWPLKSTCARLKIVFSLHCSVHTQFSTAQHHSLTLEQTTPDCDVGCVQKCSRLETFTPGQGIMHCVELILKGISSV